MYVNWISSDTFFHPLSIMNVGVGQTPNPYIIKTASQK